MKIFKATYNCVLGNLNIYSNDKYLLSVLINEDKDLQKNDYKISLSDNEIIKNTKMQLDDYFNGKLFRFDLPLYIKGTRNQKKVIYKLIEDVEYGSCISYSDLAYLSGIKNGSRFIGKVLSGNNILIIIPCHRVIRKDGSLGGYNSEVVTKRRLIKFENTIKHEIIH